MKHTVHGYKGPRKTVWFISTSLIFNFDKQSDYKALEGGGKLCYTYNVINKEKPRLPPCPTGRGQSEESKIKKLLNRLKLIHLCSAIFKDRATGKTTA